MVREPSAAEPGASGGAGSVGAAFGGAAAGVADAAFGATDAACGADDAAFDVADAACGAAGSGAAAAPRSAAEALVTIGSGAPAGVRPASAAASASRAAASASRASASSASTPDCPSRRRPHSASADSRAARSSARSRSKAASDWIICSRSASTGARAAYASCRPASAAATASRRASRSASAADSDPRSRSPSAAPVSRRAASLASSRLALLPCAEEPLVLFAKASELALEGREARARRIIPPRERRLELTLETLDLLLRAGGAVALALRQRLARRERGPGLVRLGHRGGPCRLRLARRRQGLFEGTTIGRLPRCRRAARLAPGLGQPPLQLGHPRTLRGERALGLGETAGQAIDLGIARPRLAALEGQPLGARGARLLEGGEGGGETRALALGRREGGDQELDALGLARLSPVRGRRRRRRGRRCGRRRAAALRPAAHRLDHLDELLDRRIEGADVALRDALRRERDEHQAPERHRTRVERQTHHRAHGRGRLAERRDVAVLRGAVDEVRAAIQEAVEGHVPARHVAAAHAPQAAAAFVGQAHFGGEPEKLLARIEEAECAGPDRAHLDHRRERRLERVLGRNRLGRDGLQALADVRQRRAGRAARRPPGGAGRRSGALAIRRGSATPVPSAIRGTVLSSGPAREPELAQRHQNTSGPRAERARPRLERTFHKGEHVDVGMTPHLRCAPRARPRR